LNKTSDQQIKGEVERDLSVIVRKDCSVREEEENKVSQIP